MNPAQLLAHFDRVAEAPDAIPCLRRFILDLAVRGRLVEQHPKDELALELLNRIRDETDQMSFPCPDNWVSAKAGSLLNFQYGKGLPASDRSEQGSVRVFGSNGVVGYCEKALAEKPAIIVGRKGSAGALNLCDGPSWTTDVAYFLIPPAFFQIRFLFFALQTLDLGSLGKGVKPGLSRAEAYELPIAVPPLAEQYRIVAKVDELMALCDRLEAAQAERESRRDRLAAASLHRMNNGADAESFREHARFHLAHLPRLTARPEHIQQFRQTMLNLAVRGRLVPQDPNDDPETKLIALIQSEKGRQTKTRKTMREPQLPPIDEENAPFELPSGWAWARFPELGIFGRGKSKHRPRNDPSLFEGGTHLLVQTGDVARSNGVIETFTGKYNEIGLAQSEKWPKGTLCITIAANIADSGILSFAACFPDSVVGFIPSSQFQNARYFEYFVRTAKGRLLQFAPATAQKNINLGILNEVLIPLPPLAEQYRIVAKVDELMALCDQLESQLTNTQSETRRLLEAVLHEAIAPAAGLRYPKRIRVRF
jgi:type I restriction enzyme S subunit